MGHFAKCCKQKQNRVNAVTAIDEAQDTSIEEDSSQTPSEEFFKRYVFANQTNGQERRPK